MATDRRMRAKRYSKATAFCSAALAFILSACTGQGGNALNGPSPAPQLELAKTLALGQGNFEPIALDADSSRGLVAILMACTTDCGPRNIDALWLIDATRLEVVAKIPVPPGAMDVALDTGRALAFVTSGKPNTVSVIDLETQQISRSLEINLSPFLIAAAPAARQLHLVDASTGSLYLLDLATERTHKVKGLDAEAWDVLVEPAGERTYLLLKSSVLIIDGADGETTELDIEAWNGALDLDRNHLYTTGAFGGALWLVDTATRRVLATRDLGGGPLPSSGSGAPYGITVDASRGYLYLTNPGHGTISLLDLARLAPLGTFDAPSVGSSIVVEQSTGRVFALAQNAVLVFQMAPAAA